MTEFLRPRARTIAKHIHRANEMDENMRSVTIQVEDNATGNELDLENRNVQTLDQAMHLLRTAWEALDNANFQDVPLAESEHHHAFDSRSQNRPVRDEPQA